MTRLRRASHASSVAAGLALAFVGGCTDKSLCPFPVGSAVTSTPPTPCIKGSVESCIDPTLVLGNGCDAPLYVPSDYGQFGPDGATSREIELLKGQTIHFVLRPEKATQSSDTRKEFLVPVRLSGKTIELRFDVSAE